MDDPFRSNPLETSPLPSLRTRSSNIPPDTSPFVRRPYDPEKDREWIRGGVTVASLLLFAIIVTVYIVAAFKVTNDNQWTRVKDATQVILPAVTSILGSALGFYFGSQKK